MKLYLLLFRCYFITLSKIRPQSAARQALKLFQRPMNGIMRPIEKSFYEQATHFKIQHEPEDLDCYELGNSNGPLIIMVHGWETNAGSMSAIAAALAKQGFRVVLFNLPAHGTSKLKYANILSCSEALKRVLTYFRYTGRPSIVTHSFGSAVATYTLARTSFKIDKFVMLSTPDKLLEAFLNFRKLISLGDRAFDQLISETEKMIGENLEDIAVNKMINEVQLKDLSIIHDELDRVIPYQNSVNVYRNSPKAKLTTIEKVGHYRMLWNQYVIKTVMNEFQPVNHKAA